MLVFHYFSNKSNINNKIFNKYIEYKNWLIASKFIYNGI